MNTSAPNNKKFDGFRVARELMDQHGLHGWKLRWMEQKSSRICGRCKSRGKIIELSRMYFVMTEDEAVKRNTILHEIAHALQYERAGYMSHDKGWKSICAEIGCDGERLNEHAVLPARGKAGLYGSGIQIEED